ncbi:MAG TPA: C25 family cysteine peptidase [bacterium]|nr:C25 family cysteine peptidase [bacterium]
MKNYLKTVAFITLFIFVSCSDDNTEPTENADDLTDAAVDENQEKNDENTDAAENEADILASDIDTNDDINDDDTAESSGFATPDPAFSGNPLAVIVTRAEYSDLYNEIAGFHTVTGIYTKVVTIESICAIGTCNDADPKNDTAKAIKKFISSIAGLKYLVLGGDIEVVPSRKVHDKYSNIMAGTFEDDFYTDFYYADLSEWDSNGNGIYAEDTDTPDYSAEIAVGRIPSSNTEEITRYFGKIIAHMTRYNTMHVKTSLLIANVATNFSGVDINAGYYFETEGRTTDIIPFDFSKKKLYASTIPSPASDAIALDNAKQEAAMTEGVNIIVHNGHGYPSLLSCEQANDDNDFTGQMAYNLQNSTYPIFLSCACQAGQFEAPFTYNSHVFKDDSAGEMLVNAPLGGAVAYLGNTITGLGIAGGSQFIDEMLRSIFFSPTSILGDSYLSAHSALKQSDTFQAPVPLVPAVPVVDEDSWRWTKKSVVLIGTPLLTVWRDAFPQVNADITVTSEKITGGYKVSFTVPYELDGFNLKIMAGESVFTFNAIASGEYSINIEGEFSYVLFGGQKKGSQFFFKKADIL